MQRPRRAFFRRLACAHAVPALVAVLLAACRREPPPAPPAAASAPAERPIVPLRADPKRQPELPEAMPEVPKLPSVVPLPPAAPRVRRTGPVFSLPTGNDALLRDEPAVFYMFVDRYKDGQTSQVWQGGAYGFVRNPRSTATGEVYTKFHEGIDIAPMERDARGEPQDTVRAVADGTVAYCLRPPLSSNYGNYVVVAHPCGNAAGTFYSLYAHLKRIETAPGTTVRRGDPIGKLGYTGAGIDRRRAHVHLEICLLLSERFDEHLAKQRGLPNGHGNFHGSNLIGIDAAGFLRAAHEDPGLTPADFLQGAKPYWKALVPCRDGAELDIAKRYPWLRRPGAAAASWEISFDGAGVPLAIAPSSQDVQFPSVSWVQPSPASHSWPTRNLLAGTGAAATLAPEGSRYVQLVSGDF